MALCYFLKNLSPLLQAVPPTVYSSAGLNTKTDEEILKHEGARQQENNV
jgi:hypothetical protein